MVWRVCCALLLAGCVTDDAVDPDSGPGTDASIDSGSDEDVGVDTSVPAMGETFSTSLGPIELGVGQENANTCFFWSLHNEETLWVNAVHLRSSAGIHHSNWFHVRPSTFEGEDGVHPCRARGFDTLRASVEGGVLFAQSTQSETDDQVFAPGTALRIPPDAVIVADIHLLNITPDDLEIEAEMDIVTIPEESVTTRLNGLAFDYLDLEIPARMGAEFSMDCDFGGASGEPIDFKLYYVLPHYHELGVGMRLELIGGERDGEILWETRSSVGDPLGEGFDPPLELNGADGIRVTCVYDNPRSEDVGYGIGDQEMCLMLAFTDSEFQWGGGVLNFGGNSEVSRSDGVSYNTGECMMIPVRPR